MKKLSDAINEVLLGRKKDEKIEHLELKLDRARALIKEAINQRSNISIEDGAQYVPHGNIYNNAFAFHRYYTSCYITFCNFLTHNFYNLILLDYIIYTC